MRTKKMKVYLSGGMEYARNEGADWRSEIGSWLKENLEHNSFNPNEESKKYLGKKLCGVDFRSLKSLDIARYTRLLNGIVDHDSREIAYRSDYLICLWDSSAQRGAGTKGELTIARFFSKPVYLVTKKKLESIPGWVLGCSTKIFGSMDELKNFLQKKYRNRDMHSKRKG